MTTKRERILQRLLAILEGLDPAPVLVDRNRLAPVAEGETPAVILFDGGESYEGRTPLGRSPVAVTATPVVRWVAADHGEAGAVIGGRLSSILGQIQRAIVSDGALADLLGDGGLVGANLEDDLTPAGGTAIGHFALHLQLKCFIDFKNPEV